MSRLPHFVDSPFTDGGQGVNLRRWPAGLSPRKIPGTDFYYRLSRPHGHIAAARIRSFEQRNDLIGNRTRDIPACSIVPQPTMLLRDIEFILYL
jgi:hypothetical protein